jgi:ribosomal protein S18 acetylase RimI-like enzyme
MIRMILDADRIWAAYALADLQPAFEPYCRWWVADAAGGSGLVLFYSGLEPTVLMSVGEPTAIATALQEANAAGELPAEVYLSVREAHLPVVERFYDNSADRRPMLRMALGQGIHPAQGTVAPVPLSAQDGERLHQLYTHGGPFAPDAFDPYQVDNGVFFGIRDECGELAAAGGTHIVNWAEGVAAIGNIYTRPDCRGRGYARAITAAIVAALQAEGAQTIVLNVDQRNHAARRLYETLGFEIDCTFFEGVAKRHE